jgi:hypothetical protein
VEEVRQKIKGGQAERERGERERKSEKGNIENTSKIENLGMRTHRPYECSLTYRTGRRENQNTAGNGKVRQDKRTQQEHDKNMTRTQQSYQCTQQEKRKEELCKKNQVCPDPFLYISFLSKTKWISIFLSLLFPLFGF